MEADNCDICTNVRPFHIPIHIGDDGLPLNPNPVHSAHFCAACLIARFDTNEQCPICRGRFLRPADPMTVEEALQEAPEPTAQPAAQPATQPAAQTSQPATVVAHCAYITLHRTAHYPNRMCMRIDITRSQQDNCYYCPEHIETGPLEVGIQNMRQATASIDSISSKKRRLGEMAVAEKLKRTKALTVQHATSQFFGILSHASAMFDAGTQQLLQQLTASNNNNNQPAPPPAANQQPNQSQ